MGRRQSRKKNRHRRRNKGKSSGSSSSSDSESKYAKCGCKRKDGRRSVKEKTRKSELARKMPRYPDGRFKSKWADFDFSKLRAAVPVMTSTGNPEANVVVLGSAANPSSSVLSSSTSQNHDVKTPPHPASPVKKETKNEEKDSTIKPTPSGNQAQNPVAQTPQLPMGLPGGIAEMLAKLIAEATKAKDSGGSAPAGNVTTDPKKDQEAPPIQEKAKVEVNGSSVTSSVLPSSSTTQTTQTVSHVVQTPQVHPASPVKKESKNETEKDSTMKPTSSGNQTQNLVSQTPQLPAGLPDGVSDLIAKLIAQAMKGKDSGVTAAPAGNGTDPKKDKNGDVSPPLP